MAAKRKYPVGVQSFEKLRKEGYLYIDKTPLIYKMITESCPYFLSRPRRFGKSLLISTLAAVFEGRHDLFEAFTTDDGTEQTTHQQVSQRLCGIGAVDDGRIGKAERGCCRWLFQVNLLLFVCQLHELKRIEDVACRNC